MKKSEMRRLMKSEGLNREKQDYAFVLMRMGRKLWEAIEEAKIYEGLV